ncbi:MAG: hypothetical protein AABY64_03665 [Bdellovibrionota bacterium]
MSFKNELKVAGLTVLLCAGCANRPHKTEESKADAVINSAANVAQAHSFVEIEFDKGSASLSENAKTSLKSVLDQARSAGSIDEVLVLSWADDEYPSKNLKQLPKNQRELAKNRNKAVETYIKTMKNVDVDSYNMAEQPNLFSKWFNTSDNKLKSSFIAAGLPTTADDPQNPKKASHSVILVKVE